MSNKSKTAFINQMAPLYRAPIYELMDKMFDIDWFFGESVDNIKEMDFNSLKSVSRFKTVTLPGKFYWQKNIIKLLFNKEYNNFLFHAESYNLTILAFMLLNKCLFKKKHIFLWTHGWYGRENLLKKIYKKFYYSLSDKNFLYGDFAKKVAISQNNDGNKCIVIHNSLNHNIQLQIRQGLHFDNTYLAHFKNDNPVLIFIGRLTPIKKLDLLLRAVSMLKTHKSHYNVVFIGDGTEKNSLKVLAEQLNIPVWFYGECYDEKQIANLIYNADICVSPGNVGLTAMHALVYGTPVITHNDFPNQMPEFEAIIEGETGAFYDYGSVESLACTIDNWQKLYGSKREEVRIACQKEIDTKWNPSYQIQILQKYLQ